MDPHELFLAAYAACGALVVWVYNRQVPKLKRSGKYGPDEQLADKLARMILIPLWPALLFAIAAKWQQDRKRPQEKNGSATETRSHSKP